MAGSCRSHPVLSVLAFVALSVSAGAVIAGADSGTVSITAPPGGASADEAYWTQDRLRDAKPMPLPSAPMGATPMPQAPQSGTAEGVVPQTSRSVPNPSPTRRWSPTPP